METGKPESKWSLILWIIKTVVPSAAGTAAVALVSFMVRPQVAFLILTAVLIMLPGAILVQFLLMVRAGRTATRELHTFTILAAMSLVALVWVGLALVPRIPAPEPPEQIATWEPEAARFAARGGGNTTRDLARLLKLVQERYAGTLKSDVDFRIELFVVDTRTGRLVLPACEFAPGWSERVCAERWLDVAEHARGDRVGAAGFAFREQRVFTIPDTADDPRWVSFGDEADAWMGETRSIVLAPVLDLFSGRALGVICLAADRPYQFPIVESGYSADEMLAMRIAMHLSEYCAEISSQIGRGAFDANLPRPDLAPQAPTVPILGLDQH
ncbi:MAG: GAF domain-containing protein [Phycisphaerales bacterium]|nr:GAF domain-containing protein [Phycisphaerales bacterium]